MKYSVLLVDDEANILTALTRALRKEPYDFQTALSGHLALGMMEQSPADVIISDEMMPGMSGTELLAHVRDAYPETIRMMLTGTDSLGRAERAMQEGAVFRFFRKPFDPMEIGRAIYDAILLRSLTGGDDPRLLMPLAMQKQILDEMSPAPAVQGQSHGSVLTEAEKQRERMLLSTVPKVVQHLRRRLEQAESREQVVDIFADIRRLLAQINSSEHRGEVVEVFRQVWEQIQARIES